MICITKSAARLLNIEPEQLELEVGHTGEEVVCYGRRSIHVQELVPSFLERGYSLTIIQSQYMLGHQDSYIAVEEERFQDYVRTYNGILFGKTEEGKAHAIAKINGAFYDPSNDSTISKCSLKQVELFAIVLPVR